MANTAAPRGFKVLGNAVGAPFSGSVAEYKLASGYATSIFEGDLVKLTSTGYLERAGATDAVVGVFQGVKYRDSRGVPQYSNMWTAGTTTLGSEDVQALVVDDAGIKVSAQFNTASALTTAKIGETFAHTVTAGSTLTGVSAEGADFSTAATTLQTLRYEGLLGKADNDATGYAIGVFSFVNHLRRLQTGV